MLLPIRRALLSVSDKSGLIPFATALQTEFQVELIATGGTKTALAAAGLNVRDVSELTQFPEILDGRVKTLHPNLYAGILANRAKPDHLSTLETHQLLPIDLVVCNLYPFEETIVDTGVNEAQAIEQIDIGGPSMIRAAAKNFAGVAVAIDPNQYDVIVSNLRDDSGSLTLDFRRTLAAVAFERIADYDAAIANYFLTLLEESHDDTADQADDGSDEANQWEEEFDPPFNLIQPLRYGENPHQAAAFYREPELERACVATAEQLHGKELSYNNILDLDSALNCVREFVAPTVVVVKHNNPCGIATAPTLAGAFSAAWDGDPLSAFGGIVALNLPMDVPTAELLMTGERFVECIIAPDYDGEALAKLKSWKKNVRLLKSGPLDGPPEGLDYRRVDGGLLVQTRDIHSEDFPAWEVKTERQPTDDELTALAFAWLACKHVKSNAIVLAKQLLPNTVAIVGVGAGQLSRVVAVEVAAKKAGTKAEGSVLASDAFFPFPDNVELAAAAGVTAIVQPGGSIKDEDSIAACNRHGIAMLFTSVRHFRH